MLLALLSTYLHRVQRVLHSRAPLLDAGTEFPLEFPLESRTPNERRQLAACASFECASMTVHCALCSVRCAGAVRGLPAGAHERAHGRDRHVPAGAGVRSTLVRACSRAQHDASADARAVLRDDRGGGGGRVRGRRAAHLLGLHRALVRPLLLALGHGLRQDPHTDHRVRLRGCTSAPHDALSLYVLYLPMDEYLQNRKLSNMTNSGISVNTILGSIIIS